MIEKDGFFDIFRQEIQMWNTWNGGVNFRMR